MERLHLLSCLFQHEFQLLRAIQEYLFGSELLRPNLSFLEYVGLEVCAC